MKDGAVDFLPKPVKDKISCAPSNQALVRSVRERAERNELEEIQSRVETLTAREREVMNLVVKGMVEQANRLRAWHRGKNR